jgi:predicted transcriptional regulator
MGLLAELGIDRQTKYRTLKKLAAAGVITVKHNGQHAPVVTLPKGGRHV